jgi:hypothetical protein
MELYTECTDNMKALRLYLDSVDAYIVYLRETYGVW